MAGEEKPRIFQGGRDMMLSLGVIVISMLLVVGATGLCTINPETSDLTATREVDGAAFLDLEARTGAGAIRVPDVPQDWVANSARRAVIENQPASVVGWVTPADGYVSAWQTQVELADALSNFDEHFREETTTKDVDGRQVTIASSHKNNVRDLWGLDLGDERVIVTGTASEEDLTTLVRAFVDVAPLPQSVS